jgi:hypothetical protein
LSVIFCSTKTAKLVNLTAIPCPATSAVRLLGRHLQYRRAMLDQPRAVIARIVRARA